MFWRHFQFLLEMDEEAQQDHKDLMARMFDDSDDKTNQLEHAAIFNRIPNQDRDTFSGHPRLMADYLNKDAVYNNDDFERHFRVTKGIFFRLRNDLQTKNSTSYFIQKPDCTGKMGLSTPLKVTCALRQLGYGVASNATDEYVRIGGTTARQTLKMFASSVVNIYGSEYLQQPTNSDLKLILEEN